MFTVFSTHIERETAITGHGQTVKFALKPILAIYKLMFTVLSTYIERETAINGNGQTDNKLCRNWTTLITLIVAVVINLSFTDRSNLIMRRGRKRLYSSIALMTKKLCKILNRNTKIAVRNFGQYVGYLCEIDIKCPFVYNS